MKRTISMLLAVIICAGMLTACGGTGAAPTEAATTSSAATELQTEATTTVSAAPTADIPIRFMYWNKEESLAELVKLIQDKVEGVDFQFEFVDIASFQQVYNTQLSAGEGPDILCMEKVWVEAAAGYPLELTQYDFVSRYTESVIDEMSVDGRVYAIPGVSWFGGWFYNKGLFDQQGWTIPKTYDEFLDLCERIQQAGIMPIANPIQNPNFLMHYALGYVMPAYTRSPEGMNFDKDFGAGKVNMADHFGPYLDKWAEVVRRGYVSAIDLGKEYDQAIDEFSIGAAAIFDSGPWDVDIIYEKNPDIVIDMMPFVGDDPNDPGWLFGGPGIRFGINAKMGEPGNENKLDACVRILDLISTPEGQYAYWENNKGGSSYLKGVELEMPPEYDGVREVFAAGQVYAPWNPWAMGVYEEFGTQLQGFVAGDTSLEEVMEATDAKSQEVLAMGDN